MHDLIKRKIYINVNSRWVISIVTMILMLFSTAYFHNRNNQGINWTFPYFSGAANFNRLFDWRISPSDFEQVQQLTQAELRTYKHQRTDDLVSNTVNNYGYVLVALTSRTLFPYLGDIHGAILLQLLVHLSASLFMVLIVLDTPLQKYGFIILYAANPVIIYFTTFPFYYFWMFIPSMAFVILILRPEWRKWFVFFAMPVIIFSILIRPTTVFLAGLFFLVAFLFSRTTTEKWRTAIAACLFIACIGFIASSSSSLPWHHMYIGLGGHPNDFGVSDLKDKSGYEYFYKQSGISIETNAIHGNWNDPRVRQIYMQTLKERYFEILKENPLSLIRNAVTNILQVFSIGYIMDIPIFNLLNVVIGFLTIVFFVYTRQYIWIIAILASAISFAWYFPPIPAYNFAAYFLLVVGGISGLESLVSQIKNNRRTNMAIRN